MTSRTLPRIAALLRKAESTDNEHEAAAYMEAAQRLASTASIDLTVARAHTTSAERRATPTQREVTIGDAGRRGLRTYVELYLAIARANDVTCDVARNSTRVFAYGFDTDLEATQTLYSSLVVQMVRGSDAFIKSGAYSAEQVRRYSAARRRWEIAPVSPVTARISFQRAYAARIGRRLSDARAKARREAEDNAAAQERARKRAVRQAERSGRRSPSGAVGVGSGAGIGVPAGDAGSMTSIVAAGELPVGGRKSVALALRAKDLELAEHYRKNSTARGTWKGSSASAGYSEHASRAGDQSARRARLGTEAAIGGHRPQLPQ